MFNERAFIAQVEAAGTEELANLLMRPTLEQEKALRAHLGDERYQRMHSMALKRSMACGIARGFAKPPGNVVVIHGIMGAELSVSSGGNGDLTWVNAFRIMRGWLDRLRLDPSGRKEADDNFKVVASGIMKRYYGEMLLSLSGQWNVQGFWFDWRKDLNLAADALNTKINEWFGKDAPVHIVAHSMGGLAARTFIANYPERWRSMWDQKSGGIDGGRLVMLGTPNRGSYTIPTVITGLEGMVRKLALLDLRHDVPELLETLNTFVGTYQMLPAPDAPDAERLYTAGTYTPFKAAVSQQHLDNARAHHLKLGTVVDAARMIYVAGYDQPTFAAVADFGKLNSLDGYKVTMDGDGRVSHELGKLKGVPTYYIKESHGALSSNALILRALEDLLRTGETTALSSQLPGSRGAVSEAKMKAKMTEEIEQDESQIRVSLTRMRSRGMPRATPAGEHPSEHDADEIVPDEYFSPEQRRLEESVTRAFLGRGGAESQGDGFADDLHADIEATSIEIAIQRGGIENVGYGDAATRGRKSLPVDAVAVGHYIGVQPQAAEEKLDRSITAALLGLGQQEAGRIQKERLLLTQYTERGVIKGKLGEPFIIPDPRGRGGRLVVLAGMGEAGSFGAPELTVLARELSWALGRLRKQHLATVLIGSGKGTLSTREAVAAWINGVRRALTNSAEDEGRNLRRITFVEYDHLKIRRLQNAIIEESKQQKQYGLSVKFNPLTDEELDAIEEEGEKLEGKKAEEEKKERRERKRQNAGRDDQQTAQDQEDAAPTRVNLSLDVNKKTYCFGAITESAAVPERVTQIDPKLVMRANDELVGERVASMQLERGRFLEGLLIPEDFRRQLYSRAPLVLMLDATTARIHWEMVAQPEISAAGGGVAGGDAGVFDLYKEGFLGTTRGLTRQLRTTFAPPPEPPPPPRRVLRVLVVADPAADAHLPGAQEEGVAVADLFESYNLVHQDEPESSHIKVTRMFGPFEATRTNVLRELMSRSYDVLHYAGHCVFEWDGEPDASGWIFNMANKELLSAFELNRIDRVPKFVFSNACESGITPDRSEERNAYLAPSFAEAFFNRGVSNFVCTAWPVDDLGARQFALGLYSKLLGLRPAGDQPDRYEIDPDGPRPMHIAMRDARTEIAATTNGRTTWGAYQHYGSPYFQFFYPKAKAGELTPAATANAASVTSVRKAGSKGRRGGKKMAKNATKKVKR